LIDRNALSDQVRASALQRREQATGLRDWAAEALQERQARRLQDRVEGQTRPVIPQRADEANVKTRTEQKAEERAEEKVERSRNSDAGAKDSSRSNGRP
jgi:hypothetical protein